jgi:hypothetical protein
MLARAWHPCFGFSSCYFRVASVALWHPFFQPGFHPFHDYNQKEVPAGEGGELAEQYQEIHYVHSPSKRTRWGKNLVPLILSIMLVV